MMSDSQWPRYMVFQQMDHGKPYVHNGTVHAPDLEMALLNGRDVFVRRPNAVGMFVVAESEIYARSLEELEKDDAGEGAASSGGESQAYSVFGKISELGQCQYIGEVDALSPFEAMQTAIKTFEESKVLLWWVFPTDKALHSEGADGDSMFKPVLEHHFKDQAHYHVMTLMRQIKQKGKLKD
jgi:ring-1,2-phenylacetyl-CoA epoxidase subunit PaaB